MSYALLSILITVALRRTGAASAVQHLQKAPVIQLGVQQHAATLPRQQPACSNLLDANELHGDWVEGAPDIQAGRLLYFWSCLPSPSMWLSKQR